MQKLKCRSRDADRAASENLNPRRRSFIFSMKALSDVLNARAQMRMQELKCKLPVIMTEISVLLESLIAGIYDFGKLDWSRFGLCRISIDGFGNRLEPK